MRDIFIDVVRWKFLCHEMFIFKDPNIYTAALFLNMRLNRGIYWRELTLVLPARWLFQRNGLLISVFIVPGGSGHLQEVAGRQWNSWNKYPVGTAVFLAIVRPITYYAFANFRLSWKKSAIKKQREREQTRWAHYSRLISGPFLLRDKLENRITVFSGFAIYLSRERHYGISHIS